MTNQPPPPPPQGQGWGPATPPPPGQGWGTAPPPPPGQGFGPAPGFGTAGPATLPPQKKKGSAGKKILGIAGGVVVALIVAGIFAAVRGALFADDKTAEAKQGDCIAELPQDVQAGQEVDANNAKVVECSSADARYSVVGRVDGVSAAEASGNDSTVCNPFLDAGAEMIYYAIPAGGKGYVLCLKPA